MFFRCPRARFSKIVGKPCCSQVISLKGPCAAQAVRYNSSWFCLVPLPVVPQVARARQWQPDWFLSPMPTTAAARSVCRRRQWKRLFFGCCPSQDIEGGNLGQFLESNCVLARVTTYFGPRTEPAGVDVRMPSVTSVNLAGQGRVRTVTTVCLRDSPAKIVKAQWNGIGADAATFVR